jgi:hypothetical protein
MRMLPFLLLAAVGCDDSKDDDTGPGSLNASDTDADCSGTPPVIDDLTVEIGDVLTGEAGEDAQPSVLITVEFSDEDGDAHVVAVDFWYDDVVDGTVDTSGAAPMQLPAGAMPDRSGRPIEECAGDGGILGISLGVTGKELDFETEYDFAAVVIDNAGLASEPRVASGTTPAALPE